jgi:Tfp pilus assembly protein PilO
MAANEWSERTRMIVTVSIGAVVNIALAGVLYSVHGDYQKLVVIHQQKSKQIADLKLHAITERGPKEDKLKELRQAFETKREKLPESENITKLLDDLAPIAEKTKCQKESNDIGAPTDEGNLRRTAFKTRWHADFFGWCKMVNEIEERFPRFISFEGMSLTPKNSGMVETGSIDEITVDLVTYEYVKDR